VVRSKTKENDLGRMTLADLRQMAKERGISGGYRMRKEELVNAMSGDGVRRGPGSSKSLRYAQEIHSPDQHADRPGRSLVTTNHDVIMMWAGQRDARPATVPGTEHDGHPGVLRFDFPGYGGRELAGVSWDEWFAAFDGRGLNFIYQEQTSDGRTSNFFQLENPHREDA
jgi:hypothetical protein